MLAGEAMTEEEYRAERAWNAFDYGSRFVRWADARSIDITPADLIAISGIKGDGERTLAAIRKVIGQ